MRKRSRKERIAEAQALSMRFPKKARGKDILCGLKDTHTKWDIIRENTATEYRTRWVAPRSK